MKTDTELAALVRHADATLLAARDTARELRDSLPPGDAKGAMRAAAERLDRALDQLDKAAARLDL